MNKAPNLSHSTAHRNDDGSKTCDIKQDITHLDNLIDTMHQAEKTRTLEEQVAYLKSKGIDPSKTYQTWDDDEKEDDY